MKEHKNPMTALFEKMTAEQAQYRQWLLGQPPDEILNHAYEYSIREDIMVEMEELELTDAQVKALLKSPDTLADIYKDWGKRDSCGHMEDIQDVIENRADDIIKLEREKKADKER